MTTTDERALAAPRLGERPWLERCYDALFLLALLSCSLVGALPQYTPVLSGLLVLCFSASFFGDHFFLYAAIFMFMRNRMVIGDTTAYRFYSYLLVAKCIWELPKLKLRVAYLPLLLVFALHCVFATGQYNLRIGLNVIVDVVLIFLVVARVKGDDRLTRRFLVAFLLGMVLSGIYGFTAADAFKDIHVAGAGVEEVSRNFGSLGDANYAGFFYDAAILTALVLRGVPRWVNALLAGFGLLLLVRTASLSGFLSLGVALAFLVLLKFRGRALPILLGAVVAIALGLGVLLSIPAFRELPGISGILLRLAEKLRYIQIGRWDLLTTDRTNLWAAALAFFSGKDLLGKLFGGSVITYMLQETRISSTYMAVHQSYIQSLLNFGVLGTLAIYLPLFAIFFYRLANHLLRPAGYPGEDIRVLQLCYLFLFFFFGLTVDFFIDWTFLFFCFF